MFKNGIYVSACSRPFNAGCASVVCLAESDNPSDNPPNQVFEDAHTPTGALEGGHAQVLPRILLLQHKQFKTNTTGFGKMFLQPPHTHPHTPQETTNAKTERPHTIDSEPSLIPKQVPTASQFRASPQRLTPGKTTCA